MNKFKWQYFIVVDNARWIFLLPHESHFFKDSFWIYLPDIIMTVDAKHRQPEQAILSHCCSTPSLEALKSRERSLTCHMNRLMLEPHPLSLFFSLSRKSDEANGSYDPVIKKRSLNRSAFHFVFVFFHRRTNSR